MKPEAMMPYKWTPIRISEAEEIYAPNDPGPLSLLSIAAGVLKELLGRKEALTDLVRVIEKERRQRRGRKECLTPGCPQPIIARGLCVKCYSRSVVLFPDWTRDALVGERACARCDRLHFAKGLCKMHYDRARKERKREALLHRYIEQGSERP